MSALTVSILFSTRSRRLANTMVPPVTLMCSIEKASDVLPAAGFAGGLASLTRSRRSGKFATGRMMTRSVICGLPAHRLASVTSASMLAAAKRRLMSWSFGFCNVTSFSVMLSDGHRLILAPPLMASL